MNLWNSALNLLFPYKCPFCQRILEREDALLCSICQKELPWLLEKTAQRKVDVTEGCLSPLAYRKKVPEAVHRYKFGGCRSYSRTFGVLMAQCIQDHGAGPFDLVTWAPLSRKRLRERGFDQAEHLAQKVGGQLALPVASVLEKVRHTQAQSDLKEESRRRANALNAYRLRESAEVQGKAILLIDDVVTSGATLSECARILLQSGASSVYCLTLAQAKPGGNHQKN